MPGNKPCPPGCACRKHEPRFRQSAEIKAMYRREYRARNREKAREYARQYRAENPEKVRESNRRWREANHEYALERNRQWRATNRDRTLAGELRRRHGMTLDGWQAMWDAQGERCYLCADPLEGVRVVIEHDHSCCPQNQSGARCRRGLACGNCNSLLGFAADDPDRLDRIAGRFRIAAAGARERITESGQAELPIDLKRAARHQEESA